MPTVSSSLRVLVIEDDAASRQAIAEALRESHHTVFEAADGPAGLAIALKERLDAVVLDLKLPRMDGIQLLSKLRDVKDVPVIVVSARRTTDDRVEALELGADGRTVTLTAGTHPFRLDYQHVRAARAALAIGIRGIGLPAQSFTYVDPNTKPKIAPSIPLAPGDRPRLQRGFVPYEPKKRLYAISVGSPTGAHFAYDFETGSLLRVWRGGFIDVADMWESRGESQLAQPSGPALTLNHKPTVALLESFAHDWPDAPEPLWSSQGYTLAPDGTPTFLGKLAQLDVRDTLVPGADGRSLTRTLVFNGRNTSWETYVLVAEADVITAQPGGKGWIIGDRTYYIDLPKGGPLHPTVRTRNGRQQLVVPLSGGKVDRTLTYTLVW